MKNKYVMIQGLAFSEQGDMNKLSNLARQGWLLDSIKGCMFYKLKKGEPQDIVYSVDYQYDADEEYFSLFEEAGWNHVLTTQDSIHIFSAAKGTEPIYSDSDSEKTKYTTVMENSKKGSIISGVLTLIFIALAYVSARHIRELCIPFLVAFTISLCIFIFNFMPFIAYTQRIKQIEKYGKCTDTEAETKTVYIINLILGIGILILGIRDYISEKSVSIPLIVISLINIAMGCRYFKDKMKGKKQK